MSKSASVSASAEATLENDFQVRLQALSATYSAELKSKMDRLQQILGDAHWFSVGSYKESLIRGLLAQKVPKRFHVGTGFVVAVRAKKRVISRQIDVLIWDACDHGPLFRDARKQDGALGGIVACGCATGQCRAEAHNSRHVQADSPGRTLQAEWSA